MRYIIIFILFFISNSNYGQAALHDLKLNVFQNLNSSVNQNYIRLLNESASGNDTEANFEFDDWTNFEVFAKSGGSMMLDSANYHISDETMFFNLDGRLYYLYPNQVDYILVDNRKFISKKIGGGSKTKYKYYEVLVEGEMNLLKNKSLERKKINNHPMGVSHGVEEYELKEKVKYYYCTLDDKEAIDVPSSKKNFIKIFKRNRNSMVQFARTNNISTKSEADLIRMFTYNNQITN